ncbi:MAG: NAD-dependent epimerase/dehydratase family protein [Gemmatimonadales bacterium]|nr:NAD-dependent epimerase/dehydratase family protein [Gemmatimonadales bacterium]
MRVLAIGATGSIGRHVVDLLAGQGHHIAVLHRGETVAALPEGVRKIRGNRNRLEDSRAVLERFAPDVVLDLILYTEPQARAMVKAFRGRASRVVAVSSADVYRNYDGFRGRVTPAPDAVPLAEDAPLRETRYVYRDESMSFEYSHDYEKILVEHVVLSEPDLPATVLRLPAVYGPGDRQHRLRPYLQHMVDGRPAILLEEGQAGWRWTRGYVENVARAVALAVTDAPSAHRIYNVGDEPTLTEREWVERIGAAAGWTGDVVTVSATGLPDQMRQPLDWQYDLWTDTRRIRSELGYVEPVSLDEAVRRTVDWERLELDGATPLDYGDEDAKLDQ